MNEPETSVLLEQAAAGVPVRPAPVAQLLRAGRRARRRRNAGVTLAVAAGVVLVVGGASTVLDLTGTDDATVSATADQVGEQAASPEAAPEQEAMADVAGDAPRSGPLVGEAAECYLEYSPEAVRELPFAFDGVVSAIGPPVTDPTDGRLRGYVGVTFAVQEWFHGGSGDTVTVDLPAPMTTENGSTTSGPLYGVGSRLLVSGEDLRDGPPLEPIGWTCGFTRYYDEQTAASWR